MYTSSFFALPKLKLFNLIFSAPLLINSCVVRGNLTLSEKENPKISHHIVGTKLEDLSQIYNGKVYIKGSLKLKNIALTPSSDDDPGQILQNVYVGGTPFDINRLPELYWVKNIDQVILFGCFSS